MNLGFPTREVREGRASLLVPDVPRRRGPGRRSHLPFYNPSMASNRDLTVLLLSGWLRPGASVLDGLAATGALGVRAALETARDPQVTWNDKNPNAAALIEENARRNGVRGDVVGDDLRALLTQRRFDFVDVDPFGTPVPFVDAAIQQAGRGAGLGFTATDTAPLAGAYPRACRRRYGARSMRTPCGYETAVRIFLGYLVRAAASHGRGLRPLLAFGAEHFVKGCVSVEPRMHAADDALSRLGYVRFDGARFHVSSSEPDGPHAGPLWLGALADAGVLAGLRLRTETTHAASRILSLLKGEADMPPFFYENHAMAQTLEARPVAVAAWMEALHAMGFRAVRTHFAANGVKTDAPWGEVVRAYRRVGSDRARG